MVTARELACTVLVQVMDEGAMSHIALREALDQATETFGMEGRDRRFATALVQGTLERLLLLDAKINGLSKNASEEDEAVDSRAAAHEHITSSCSFRRSRPPLCAMRRSSWRRRESFTG